MSDRDREATTPGALPPCRRHAPSTPDDPWIGADGTVRLGAYLPHADGLWFSAGCCGPRGCQRLRPIGVRAAVALLGLRRTGHPDPDHAGPPAAVRHRAGRADAGDAGDARRAWWGIVIGHLPILMGHGRAAGGAALPRGSGHVEVGASPVSRLASALLARA